MSELAHRRARPDELKPCPFCGSHDIANVSGGYAGPSNVWRRGDEIFAVNCKDCGASVPNRYMNELVVEAWNTRAAERKTTMIFEPRGKWEEP